MFICVCVRSKLPLRLYLFSFLLFCCVCHLFAGRFYDAQLNFIQMTLGHITIYIRQSLFGISFIFAWFFLFLLLTSLRLATPLALWSVSLSVF